MAITYVGGRIGNAAGSTSAGITVSLTALSGGSGTTALAGDLVVVAVSTGSNTDRNIGVSTDDYTEVVELYADDTIDTNLSVSYKIMGSTPDTSVVTTPSGSADDAISVCVSVWRGVDSTNILDVVYQSNTGINSGLPTPPAITPITSGAIILCIGANGHSKTTGTFTTATLDNFITSVRNDTYDTTTGIGSYAWSSGTYTPAQFGFTETDSSQFSWCAVTLALRPISTTNTTNFFQFM